MSKLKAVEVFNNSENEILKVPFKCFCCNDSGLVKSHLIHDYVDGINEKTKPFICHGCDIGDKFLNAYHTDDATRARINSEEGKQLAEITPQKLYQLQFDPRLNRFDCLQMHAQEFDRWRSEEYKRINLQKHYKELGEKLKMQEYNIENIGEIDNGIRASRSQPQLLAKSDYMEF